VTRRGKIIKRKAAIDSIYGSKELQKFINKVMIGGKKSMAEKIVYTALENIKEKTKKEPMEVFNKALENVRPLLEVKARRVGGATYQVPIEVTRERGQALAMQWFRDVSRERGKSMIDSLTAELMDAYNGIGGVMAKKTTIHKTAEANKAFAHFRW